MALCIFASNANVRELAGLLLTQGEHLMKLVRASAGHAIFGCLQLELAPRFSEAIEAEELTIVLATRDATAPRPSDPVVGVSGGRVLEFHADWERAGPIATCCQKGQMRLKPTQSTRLAERSLGLRVWRLSTASVDAGGPDSQARVLNGIGRQRTGNGETAKGTRA